MGRNLGVLHGPSSFSALVIICRRKGSVGLRNVAVTQKRPLKKEISGAQ